MLRQGLEHNEDWKRRSNTTMVETVHSIEGWQVAGARDQVLDMATAQEERPQTKHVALGLMQQLIVVFEASFVEGFCDEVYAAVCGLWRAGCIRAWRRSAWRACRICIKQRRKTCRVVRGF